MITMELSTAKKMNIMTNDIKKAIQEKDLRIFSLYYLFKYGYTSTKATNMCMFAGLGNVQMIIEFLNDGGQQELLKIPGCDNKTILSLKKLCKQFANQNTNSVYFEQFERKIAEQGIRIEKRKKNILEEENEIKKNIEIVNTYRKIEKLIPEDYDLKTFIIDENMSSWASKVLCFNSDIKDVKELIRVFVGTPNYFSRLRNCGRITSKEIENTCLNYMQSLEKEIA